MSKKNDPTPTRITQPEDHLATTTGMRQLVAAVEGIASRMATEAAASSASDYELRFLALRRALAIRTVDAAVTVATNISAVPIDPAVTAGSIQLGPS